MTCDDYDYDHDCEYDNEYGEVDECEDDDESRYCIPVRTQDEDAAYAESIPALYPQDKYDPWRGMSETTLKRVEEICFPFKRDHPHL